jgi:hypothetical protein
MTRVVHLVPHTHWDREWYAPFQSFRLRLVELMDNLLDLMEAHQGLAFTLDGQTAVVDDYLEVRPEAEERIRPLVGEGRLAVGPWQMLMDEFLVSGESIVRNLQAGWRRAEELGGAMPVGYLPDMFGHIAQMPQILHRAGIHDAVVWRGVPAAVERHAFAWEAPDGSTVRAEYLPGGYGNAAYLLHAPPGRLAETIDHFGRVMAPFFGEDDLLAMHGTDHAAPLPDLMALLEDLNRRQDRYLVRLGTLPEYLGRFEGSTDGLARWRGELRSGGGPTCSWGLPRPAWTSRLPAHARSGHWKGMPSPCRPSMEGRGRERSSGWPGTIWRPTRPTTPFAGARSTKWRLRYWCGTPRPSRSAAGWPTGPARRWAPASPGGGRRCSTLHPTSGWASWS